MALLAPPCERRHFRLVTVKKPTMNFPVITTFQAVQGRLETRQQLQVSVADIGGAGQEIVLVGEAWDANDVTGPGRSFSTPMIIKVVAAESLRGELDRALSAVKDRVAQARSHLVEALRNNEDPGERALAQARLERATDQLGTRGSRWQQNRLDADRLPELHDAARHAAEEALPAVHDAGDQSRPALLAAERAVGELEARLRDVLRNNDFERELRHLIQRQQALTDEATTFVQAHLTGVMNDADRMDQAHLGARQRDLAAQVQDWERRLLASTHTPYRRAQQTVRDGQAAGSLAQAASALQADRQRSDALRHQRAALAVLEQALADLLGGDSRSNVAEAINRLAAQQERLADDARANRDADAWQQEQAEVAEATERVQDQADNIDSDAAAVSDGLQAAQEAMAAAQDAAAAGNDEAAAEAADLAAAHLRQAARQAADADDEQQDQQQANNEQQQRRRQLQEILREQLAAQKVVLEKAVTLQEKPQALAVRRLAKDQDDIALILSEEALLFAAGDSLAEFALRRPIVAATAAANGLAEERQEITPPTLQRIAHSHRTLARLFSILDDIPPAEMAR